MRNPVKLVVAFVGILVLLVVTAVVLAITGSTKSTGIIKPTPDQKIEANKDSLEKINKNTQESIEDLYQKAEEEKWRSVGAKSQEEYNRVLYIIDSYYESLSIGDYEAAYKAVSQQYLTYKNISNINEYRAHVLANKQENVSFILKDVRTIAGEDGNTYICKVLTIPRSGGEEYSTVDRFEEYINSGMGAAETIVIKYETKEKYYLSFEGILDNNKYEGVKKSNSKVEISLVKTILLADNQTILRFAVNNISGQSLNAGEVFKSIMVKDSKGEVFYSSPIANTADNDVVPGDVKEFDLKVQHGSKPIVSIQFELNN